MGAHLEVWWRFIKAEQQKKLPEMGPNAHPPEFSWKCLSKNVRHFYPRRKYYGNRYGPIPIILQHSHFIHTYVCFLSRSVVSESCDPIDCSLPGSSSHGILQARMLEWVATSFSNTYIHIDTYACSVILCDPIDCSARLHCWWDSPGKNTGVGCMHSSGGSSWPRHGTQVSVSPALAGGFFTTSAAWEAPAKEQREFLEVVKIWLQIQRVTGKCSQYTSILVQVSRKLTPGRMCGLPGPCRVLTWKSAVRCILSLLRSETTRQFKGGQNRLLFLSASLLPPRAKHTYTNQKHKKESAGRTPFRPGRSKLPGDVLM